MPKPGRPSETLLSACSRRQGLVVMLFQFQFEQRFQLVRLDVAADHQAQAIGDEVQQVMVGHHLGIVAEDGAVLGPFDMVFQCHEAIAAGLVQQLVDQAQGGLVVVGAVLRALEHAHDAAERLLDDLARGADQERAQRRAADNHQLVGLPQRAQLSMRQHIAAEDADDDDDEANDDEHGAARHGRGY